MDDFVPQTYEEWQRYVNALSGEALFDAAEAAADMRFARLLLREGRAASDVKAILHLFAERFVSLGMAPPSWKPGDVINYRDPYALP